MTIVRWEPLREFSTLQNEMNRLFNTVFDAPPRATAAARCAAGCRAMDLVETADHFVLRADLPGLAEDDVKIEFEDAHAHRLGRAQGRARGARARATTASSARSARSRARSRCPRASTPRRVTATLRPRRARGPHPEARGAQAAPHRDRRRPAARRSRPSRPPAPARRARANGARRSCPCFEIRTRDPARAPAPARCGSPTARSARRPSSRSRPRRSSRRSRSARPPSSGFDMVLGNTFHLFLTPGHELIAQLGGLHRFMRWDRPIITDSGGFQVFSMGHGTVADEIKGRAAQAARRRARRRDPRRSRRRASRSAPTSTARRTFMGPETSMEVQAALGSDIALVFDECTPFHGGRDYTARSTERTHRWLDRCLDWHAQHGPEGQIVYGIVQGGVEEDLRRASAQEVAARPVGGHRDRRHARRGQGRRCTRSSTGRLQELDRGASRATCSGIGEVDDLVRGVELGIDTFDCAMPTRIGRHGMAIVPDPEHRWRVDLAKARYRDCRRAAARGLPVPGLRARLHPRATCTTCSRRASRPASGCSRSTTSPTCSG